MTFSLGVITPKSVGGPKGCRGLCDNLFRVKQFEGCPLPAAPLSSGGARTSRQSEGDTRPPFILLQSQSCPVSALIQSSLCLWPSEHLCLGTSYVKSRGQFIRRNRVQIPDWDDRGLPGHPGAKQSLWRALGHRGDQTMRGGPRTWCLSVLFRHASH